MHRRDCLIRGGAWAALGAWSPLLRAASAQDAQARPHQTHSALVLCYHRFADTVADSMTVRTATFAEHLKVIQQTDAQVIPMADLVAYQQGRRASLPPKAIVISVDDGHRSVAETMAPMVRKLNWPITLFIYPSAISNASYAMKWDDLKALHAEGHYSIQSHTYWHPNLVKERRQQSPADFERFATNQLVRSRKVLQDRFGEPINYLAWPFGLYDDGLMALAAQVGYEAAFALGNKAVTRQDPIEALPRHLMVDAVSGPHLAHLIQSSWPT